MSQNDALLPGASIGVIGGGQLGRYFVIAARRLGYTTWVLDPDATAPAMQMCEHPVVGAYDDQDALQQLADACDAVTIEFENVPAASLELIAQHTRIAPSVAAVTIAQDRHAEKKRAREFGLNTAPYAVIATDADINSALKEVQLPAILKTNRLGYDGKGQQTCHNFEDIQQAFHALGSVDCVLEQRIELQAELSVVVARGFDGESVCFPVAQNIHTDGILDVSLVPASADQSLCEQAQALSVRFADGLNYVGVLAIEFFIDAKGELLFNEMAPRPHNSGHYTLDATVCCQFEQQLRALCGLPLGSTQLLSPVCMLNVLGDSWSANNPPDWHSVMAQSGAHLHLYGKAAARPGRKMGHINCLGESAAAAESIARSLRSTLRPTGG